MAVLALPGDPTRALRFAQDPWGAKATDFVPATRRPASVGRAAQGMGRDVSRFFRILVEIYGLLWLL